MLADSIKNKILTGMNYSDYLQLLHLRLNDLNNKERNEKEESDFKLLKLNSTRSDRINKTFTPDNCTNELLNNINEKQVWLIISELWCADSSQVIPYVAKIASLNPLINLKILLRDENPDVMDLYLTNGTRSIPVLAAFDEDWNEIFKWGPRPEPARELVLKMKEEGVTKQELQTKLHTWYAMNKGKAIIDEICEILRREIAEV